MQCLRRRRAAKKHAAAAKSPAAGLAHAAMGSGSGHHSSSTSLPASSSGGAPRGGRSGSGDAAALGQRRSRGPSRSAAADAAADEEAAADAATLLSVSQPRAALLPSDHPSRLGSSRLSAFAQYSSEPVGSFGADQPAAARATGGGGGDRGEDAKRRSISRQDSEHSREPQITSSSESAAAGMYESSQGGRDRLEAEEATSRAAQARRHSQSVGEEAGSVGVAVRPTSGDMPGIGAVERLSSVPGPDVTTRFPENTAAVHGTAAGAQSSGQLRRDSTVGVFQRMLDAYLARAHATVASVLC